MITVLVGVIAASAWFFLYIPNRAALQKLLVHNAILQGTARADAVLSLVDRCREGAASLSSRTMLKRAMQEYYVGTRSLDNVREFHQGLYDDGARVLVWLSGTMRCMDGQVVARYGTRDMSAFPCEHESVDMQLSFNYVEHDEFIPGLRLGCAESLHIVSPVKQDGFILGYDCLCFSLTEALDTLLNGSWKITIVSMEAALKLHDATEQEWTEYSPSLFYVENSIGVFFPVPDSESAVVVSTDYDVFFSPGFRYLRAALARFLAVLVALLTGSNLFIVYVLHRLLKRLETSRDQWREASIRDSLTGLYSRRSLENWIETELSREQDVLSVVMIDLDGFKEINDTLGHDAGDAILMSFAPLVQNVLRSDDIAIRYGGDEFLLILRKSDQSIAHAVMARLEESLASMSVPERSIGISWGMATLVPPASRKDFAATIHAADEAMYDMKREHRKKK